jgi:rhomboid protease GluP
MHPTTDPGAPADRPISETFVVTFGERGILGIGLSPRDSLRLAGKGTLEVTADTVVIRGPRPRPFLRAVTKEHVVALADIHNVVGNGTTLRFEIQSDRAVAQFVVCETADEARMHRLLALLPHEMSPEFATTLAESREFHQTLARLSRKPRVTPAIVAINVVVFVLLALAGAGVFQPDGEVAARWGSNFGPLTMGGQWWRLFTATFIHFGVFHLALNMWALFNAGLLTERLYGSGRFALLYVFAGLTGSMASLLWNPLVNSAGASGAIFGVFGGMLAFVMSPRNGVPRSIISEHRNSTLLFVGYNLFYGAAHAGIDNAAHVGGLLGGFLIGLLLARPLDDRRLVEAGGKRLLGAGAAAIAVLGLLVQPLLHPSDRVQAGQAYELAMFDFDARQALAIQATSDALALARPDTPATDRAAANALLREALPRWTALSQQFASPKLEANDPHAVDQSLMFRYLDARRRYCELLARSVLEGKPQLQEQAAAAAADAEAAVQALNARNQ